MKLFSIVFLLTTSTLFGQAPTSGLVAYYPFNGNANDASGKNNHGTVFGIINSVPDRKGTANNAFQFTDGSKIRVTNNASLTFSTGFSFSGWIRLRSMAGRDGDTGAMTNLGAHVIFAKNCDRDWLYSMLIATQTNTLNFSSGTWYSTWLSNFLTYSPGTWMHVTISYDANSHYLQKYINGRPVAEARATIDFAASNTTDLLIGGMDCWSYYFNGDMDELRFYNRALTREEVISTYAFEKAPIQSIKDGSWNDYTVWSCNCIPQPSDVLQVSHQITVPVNNIAQAFQINYTNNGKVTLGQGAKLFLNK